MGSTQASEDGGGPCAWGFRTVAPLGWGGALRKLCKLRLAPASPALYLVQSRGCRLDETTYGPAGVVRFRSKASFNVPVLSCEAFLRTSMRKDLKPAFREPL